MRISRDPWVRINGLGSRLDVGIWGGGGSRGRGVKGSRGEAGESAMIRSSLFNLWEEGMAVCAVLER